MRTIHAIGLAAGSVVLMLSAPSAADPCKGALPTKGGTFAGVVRYVSDGDGLCIGPPGRPERWIEVRLADFHAPELNEVGGKIARAKLVQLAMGRRLSCRAGRLSYDRVVALCWMNGSPVGELLRARGAAEGGRGWPGGR